MASRPDTVRASGSTQVEEVTNAESEKNEKEEGHEDPAASDDSPRSIFRAPGFHRMSFSWSGEDARIVAQAQSVVDERIQVNFRDAYMVMHDLFMVVRTPMTDPSGEIVTDRYGWPEWRRTPSGDWLEDWSALGRKEKEDFLFKITTRLFAWEQRAAEAWGEAMFAKAAWEERFAISFDAPVHGTVEDRTAKGRIGASEERYFGIFQTLYSRKADAIVRVMNLLGQRLKDTLDLG